MNDLRIGVIGVGRMGFNHSRVLSTLRSAEFIGCYDIDQALAKVVSEKFGGCAFAEVSDLLDKVDAVCIATPTASHLPLAEISLERGVHVFIEKPLAENPDRALELVRLVEQSGATAQVGHIERFNPAYRELKLLLEGAQLLAVDFRRLSAFPGSNTDVDVVYDLMVHDLDLMLDLVGANPLEIRASGVKAFSDQVDHASALVDYEGGPLVTLSTSRLTEEKVRRIDVTTPDAFIVADLLEKKIFVNRRTIGEYLNINKQGVKYRHESLVERILVPTVEPLLMELQHFVDCIRSQQTPAVTAEDGWRAVQFADRVRSQINGKLIDATKFSSIAAVEETLPLS